METKLYIKGKEGELRVARALNQLGFQVIHIGGAVKYSLDGNKYFTADLIAFGKNRAFWIQVKNKEPRNHYRDTGLEEWRFKKLIELEEESSLPTLVVFTDDSQNIYGNWVSNLFPTPGHGNTFNAKDNCSMVYFWLSELKALEEIIEL